MSRDDIRGPKWNITTGIPDLTGKVAIVTGANAASGIGFHIAQQLAIKGAKVYVGARNTRKAQDAITEMRKEPSTIGEDNLFPLAMNLSDLKEVQRAAREFVAKEARLDILVNNAGLLPRPLDKDTNGISVSFSTNHLGTFLFTVELLPLLTKTATSSPGVRIVTLSSTTHTIPPTGIKLDSIDSFNQELGGTNDFQSNLSRYGLSKLANILFTKELQRRLDAEGAQVVAIALHPGRVRTAGAINFVGQDNLSMLDETLSPIDGSLTPLFAATDNIVWTKKEKYSGAYLMPFGVIEEPSENARNPKLAKELWVASEQVVKGLLVN